MAGLVDTGVLMPILVAIRATRFGPTFIPTAAKTELSDQAVASASVREPT